MHNIDTIRAGVIVKDAAIMGEVFDTIGKEVGPWLRVKNNYREAFDSKESYGYRALLGNVKYESGVLCKSLFADPFWDALVEALPGEADRKYSNNVINGLRLDDMAEIPTNIAAEVQLIYEPYLKLGRVKSHLHYKVARCKEAGELVRDAAGKFELGEKLVDAIESCRKLALPMASA